MPNRIPISDVEIESLRGTVVMVEVKTKIDGIVPYEKPYWGKISRYDSESLTLNPYFESADYVAVRTTAKGLENWLEGLEEQTGSQLDNMKNLVRWVQGKEAGFSTREITFKREEIAHMHNFMNA